MTNRNSLISGKKLHVYVADDDVDDINFFKDALTEISRDIKVSKAINGLELLDFVEVVIPDIIFLDINMPVIDGIECLKQLRKKKSLDKVPVVIYSTTAREEDIKETYRLGANLYIQKPVTYTKIKSQLKDALSLSLKDLIPQPSRENYVLNLTERSN